MDHRFHPLVWFRPPSIYERQPDLYDQAKTYNCQSGCSIWMSFGASKSLSSIGYFLSTLYPRLAPWPTHSLDLDIQPSPLTHLSFPLCPTLATQATPFHILNPHPPLPHCHFPGFLLPLSPGPPPRRPPDPAWPSSIPATGGYLSKMQI